MARRPRAAAALLAVVASAGAAAPPSAGQDASLARERLAGLLAEEASFDAVFTALAMTRDKALEPLLVAMTRSEDKKRRFFATLALRRAGTPAANAALRERLNTDAVMALRAEALLSLLAQNALTDEQLTAVTRFDDEMLRCLAARELVRRGKDAAAGPVLARLTGSGDLGTASMARLALLAGGDGRQLAPLQKALTDPKTSDGVVALLMEQIANDKPAGAAPLAAAVAESRRPTDVRAKAYGALAAVDAQPAAVLAKAIAEADSPSLQVQLLRLLASREDAAAQTKALAAGEGIAAALARFEVARSAGGNEAAKPARQAAAAGHPIVLDYLLDRAAGDLETRKDSSGFYAEMLLDIIRGASADTRTMRPEHVRAARAATLLVDLGDADGLAALKEILSQRFSPRVRAVAAGLLKANSRAACDLARPLLDSPYEELSTDAILTLGRLGDPAAGEHLKRVVARPKGYPPPFVALASWYLLKAENQAAQAVQALAGAVK